MREETIDIWTKHALHHPICITTNGKVSRAGACVMGRGVAAQAKLRFPNFPYQLGARLRHNDQRKFGLRVEWFAEFNLFAFPVKYHWSDPADLELIAESVQGLMGFLDEHFLPVLPVYLPRPGCGNGGLDWSAVKPILTPYLDNRVVVVTI